MKQTSPSTESRDLRIIALAGSLRSTSINRALLEAISDLAPAEVTIDIADISQIPFYNQDLDNDNDRPESVNRLKKAVSDADGIILATPEYNFSVPGVLKNVIDWLSRPGMRSPLLHKPVGIVGASPGALGTARAQEHLKTIMLSTLATIFPHPGVVVGNAARKFEDNKLVDEQTRAFLKDYVSRLAEWLRQISAFADAA